jgi:tRNA (guanine-N7-)-methyltransferase
MRLRRKPGTRERLESNEGLVYLESKKHKGQWSKEFGNDNPIYAEFGMGKGDFVTHMAILHPNINFIGVDRKDELLDLTLRKALKKEAPNLKLLMLDVEEMNEVFMPGELSRIFLNFSDPWPKSRHARRRLTYRTFLDKYQQCLVPYGEVHFKTDSESLFEFSLNSFSEAGWRMRHITLNLHESEYLEGNVMTEYERKFVERGMKIYRLEAVSPTK